MGPPSAPPAALAMLSTAWVAVKSRRLTRQDSVDILWSSHNLKDSGKAGDHFLINWGEISMSGLLTGKVAVVSGAGRGIGRGIALTLAAQGARIVVADYGGAVDALAGGSPEPADQVVAAIQAAGGEATACYENVA